MDKHIRKGELVIAIIITALLFVGSLGIWDAAANQPEYQNIEPTCHGRYQITTKEVLHCDQ